MVKVLILYYKTDGFAFQNMCDIWTPIYAHYLRLTMAGVVMSCMLIQALMTAQLLLQDHG